MRSTATGSTASCRSTTSGSSEARTAPMNARRPPPPNRMLYETRRMVGVARRRASAAEDDVGRPLEARPEVEEPAGHRLERDRPTCDLLRRGPSPLEVFRRDRARLVVQRLRVHPRKVERFGRPRGHRRLAEEDDVEIAGAGSLCVERLAGLVALPLDGGAAEGAPRPGGTPRVARRHEPREAVQVPTEGPGDRTGEQRRLLGARGTQGGDGRLERGRMIERRPDVLELDVGMLTADLVEAPVQLEQVRIAE